MEERGEVWARKGKSRAGGERRPNNEGKRPKDKLFGDRRRAGRALGRHHRHGGRRRWLQGAGGQGGRVLELLHLTGTEHGQAGTYQHRRGYQNSQAPTRPVPRCLLAPFGCCQGEPFTCILSNLSCSLAIFLALLKVVGAGVLPHPSPSFIMWIRVYSEVGVYSSYGHFYFVTVVVSRGSSICSYQIAGVHKVEVM